MSPRSIISNILIVSGLSLLSYIYFPILLAYTPLKPAQFKSTYSIEIPKINAYAPIIANVDPWVKENYADALTKGVAQAKGFADFGQKGTIFLFAHSSLPPWQITRANTAFLRLGDLKLGDEIIVKKFEKTYLYKVVDKKKIWPDEVNTITHEVEDQIILQTCTPLGTDLQRLLVYAKPVLVE